MCACEGCEKPKARKHPLCHGHAKRYQKNGVLGGSLRKRGKSSGVSRFGPNGGECPIEGCRRRAESLGLCREHYQSIVRCGSIVEDGRIVSRRIRPDRLKYGEAWLKWSARASSHLSRCRDDGRDKWVKWAVAKKSNMRQPRYRGRSNRRPAACNATWDTKVESMRGGISNTAAKSRWDKWDRWSSTKAILIYGRRARNSQAT